MQRKCCRSDWHETRPANEETRKINTTMIEFPRLLFLKKISSHEDYSDDTWSFMTLPGKTPKRHNLDRKIVWRPSDEISFSLRSRPCLGIQQCWYWRFQLTVNFSMAPSIENSMTRSIQCIGSIAGSYCLEKVRKVFEHRKILSVCIIRLMMISVWILKTKKYFGLNKHLLPKTPKFFEKKRINNCSREKLDMFCHLPFIKIFSRSTALDCFWTLIEST